MLFALSLASLSPNCLPCALLLFIVAQGFIRINSTRLKAYNSLRGCPASLKTDF